MASRRVGAAVGVWGPPGAGKTHAARSLLQTLTCGSAYLPGTSPLSEWASVVPRSRRLPTWARRSLERLDADERLRTIDASSAILAAWARAAPFVLCIDDVQDADPESVEVLHSLAAGLRRVRGAGLLVVGRSRPPEPFTAWRVDVLTRDAGTGLVQANLGAVPPPEALAWLHARAAGNPLVLLEHLRFVRRLGSLWHDGERWRWREPEPHAVPRTLEALIDRSLDALSPAGRRLVWARALLPAEVPPDVWHAVADVSPDDHDDATAEVVRRGLFDEGEGGHDFSHPVMRETAHERIEPTERRALASRALALLHDRPVDAAQWLDERDLPDGVAKDLLRRAAAAADEAGATVAAARCRARAVRYAEGEERGRLAMEAARGLLGNDNDAVIRLAREALDAGVGAEAAHLLAGVLMAAGRRDEADAVMAGLRGDDGTVWARHLITLHGGAGDPNVVLRAWSDHPDLHRDPDPSVAYAVGHALAVVGRGEEAGALATNALARTHDPFERCRLLLVVGLARGSVGDLPEAEAAFDEAVALARTLPSRAWLAVALHNRSIALEEAGREDAMLGDVEEALGIYGEVGDVLRFASTQTKLARHLIERGSFERAEDLLVAARQTLLRVAPSPFLATCECVLSTLYDAWRPPFAGALALEHASAALRVARALAIPSKVMQALATGATAEAQHGSSDRALRYADELLELVEPTGDPIALIDSLVPMALALVANGRADEAAACLERALGVAATLPRAAVQQRVGLELDCLRRDAAAAAARTDWFATHGLHGVVQRAFRAFPELATAARSRPEAVESATAPAATGSLVRLEVLGPMRWRTANGEGFVQGEKRRLLLALLLEARLAGRDGVGRLDLIDAVFPGADEQRALVALKQLVYQVRRTLGRAGIVRSGDGYALGAVWCDAEAFLTTGDTRLWRGPTLVGLPVDRARDALHRRLAAAVQACASHDPVEAARLGRILLESEPYDPDVLALVTAALEGAGDRRGAAACFAQGRHRLAEVGMDVPAHRTEAPQGPSGS